MPEPNCPLCDSNDNQKRFATNGYDVLSCNVCELLFISPYPSNIKARYATVSDEGFSEMDVIGPQKHYLASQKYYGRIFPLIEQECKAARSVLDVGCGTGYLLQLMGKYPDMRRVGIELNSARAQFAQNKASCEIHQTPIEEFSADTKFDVIILINVLSHIPSFDRLFGAIHSLLSENGKVIFKVGEVCKDVQKGSIFDWGVPDHVHFLGLNTMDFICRKYGFAISAHRRIPLSEELFTPTRFKTHGRSLIRNIVKVSLAYTPLALWILKKAYEIRYGKMVYSSFIVLTRRT